MEQRSKLQFTAPRSLGSRESWNLVPLAGQKSDKSEQIEQKEKFLTRITTNYPLIAGAANYMINYMEIIC